MDDPKTVATGLDGLPPRSLPWAPGPTAVHLQAVPTNDGTKVVLMVLDTNSTRQVAFLMLDALEQVADMIYAMLGRAPKRLIVAGPDQIRD